jgi:hypothetical protein
VAQGNIQRIGGQTTPVLVFERVSSTITETHPTGPGFQTLNEHLRAMTTVIQCLGVVIVLSEMPSSRFFIPGRDHHAIRAVMAGHE